jgi:hypothetical protein
MMKATKKLVLRSEAVRTLTSVELRAAAAGGDAGLGTSDSGLKTCGTGTGPSVVAAGGG